MKLYNVKLPVVELVYADSPEDAVKKLTEHLEVDGYAVYLDPSECNVFESEIVEGL